MHTACYYYEAFLKSLKVCLRIAVEDFRYQIERKNKKTTNMLE